MGRSEESKRVAVLLGAAQNPQDGHHAPHWLSPGSTRLHLCIQGWSGGKVRRPNREHKCTVTQDGSASSAEAQTSNKSEANNSEMRKRGWIRTWHLYTSIIRMLLDWRHARLAGLYG